jgi:7,8-dihydropterin-6-yl-methyl-4-(beta-D-ribofuranosyl)aminobenzene 5'-phosphate synthase
MQDQQTDKAQARISLAEVDEAKIKIIMDNTIDVLMADTGIAKRRPQGAHPFDHPAPMAQHGWSVLIEIQHGEKRGTVLFDTGVSRNGILYNMDALELNPGDIQAIILSHGHADHAMGLPGLIDRLGTRHLPLVLHPDAYLERSRSDLRRQNIELIEAVGPSMLLDNMILVSGEVARTTSFETGFRTHFAKRNGMWVPDPLIIDDQCAILNVRGKGLAIVTGCGHSGIINIIRHAQELTGIQTVYAVVGGFHLTGALFEPIIPATVAALQEIKPRYLIPGHCTGWSATHQIAQTMPQAFIPNSVGTTLVL